MFFSKSITVKIEQLLVQHLYNTKKVTLHGIGIIHLNPAVALPTENEKDFTMPEKCDHLRIQFKNS